MSQNDDNSAVPVVAMVAAGAIVMAALAFAFFAFLAVIFTIFALIAWNRPFSLGKLHIQPEEARAFVYRGLLGAFLVPVFVAFASVLFDTPIDWDKCFFYLVLGGYVFGSVGIEILAEQAKNETEDSSPVPPVQTKTIAHDERAQRPSSFSFATWDDEEDLK